MIVMKDKIENIINSVEVTVEYSYPRKETITCTFREHLDKIFQDSMIYGRSEYKLKEDE